MFEIGNSLREARTRQNLSLRDAEYATKIRSKYLQALEQDDFDVIPGPTYVKAFLRTYAAYLGLDDDLLIQEYVSRFEPESKPQVLASRSVQGPRYRPPRKRSNQLMVGVIAAVIIIILGWVGLGNRGEKPAAIDSGSLQSVSTTLPGVSTTVSTGASTAGGSGSTTTSKGTAPSGTGSTQIAPGMVAMRVKAVGGSCRVVVRQDSAEGDVLFTGTLESGKSETYTNAARYWLSIDTPTRLNLVVNGKTLDVPPVAGAYLVSAAGLERL